MLYHVEIERSALMSLEKIPRSDSSKIISVTHSLAENPRPHGSKKLTGRDGWCCLHGILKLDQSFTVEAM